MALELTPPGLDFGSVAIGAPERRRTVRVTNTGPGPIEFRIGCDKKEFTFEEAEPVKLRKVGECAEIEVAFRPRKPGTVYAALTLSTRYLNFAVGLMGAGFRAAGRP